MQNEVIRCSDMSIHLKGTRTPVMCSLCCLTEETNAHAVLYKEVALGVCALHDQICPNKASDCIMEAGIHQAVWTFSAKASFIL